MHINDIPTPAVLLDIDILTANITAMADKAGRLGVALRPHVKTHKSLDIARLQQLHGARGITVSTLGEAEAFAAGGISDILYAVPIEHGKVRRALDLARHISLGITVDDLGAANYLIDGAVDAGITVDAWLKVDAGYHRAGVDPASTEALDLAKLLHTSDGINFAGILTHAGHAYHAQSPTEIMFIIGEEQRVMGTFVDRLAAEGIPKPIVSIGSTPTIALTETLSGIDEIRPGNYVFLDRTQLLLGSGTLADCAMKVLASVVSHQVGAGHAVIDAGSLALSHDPGPMQLDPKPNRGAVYDLGGNSLDPSLMVTSLSQEHGIVRGEQPKDVEPIKVGERLELLPNHSCLVTPLFDQFYVTRGSEVVDQWPIIRTR